MSCACRSGRQVSGLNAPARAPRPPPASTAVEAAATAEGRATGHPVVSSEDVSADLLIKALAGGRATPTFHVFELVFALPRFAMYMAAPTGATAPAACVTFQVPQGVARVREWVNSTFNATVSVNADGGLDQGFSSLRDGTLLWIQMSTEGGGTVCIRAQDMELAGEVLQDLAAALGITELDSAVEFPQASLSSTRFHEIPPVECMLTRRLRTASLSSTRFPLWNACLRGGYVWRASTSHRRRSRRGSRAAAVRPPRDRRVAAAHEPPRATSACGRRRRWSCSGRCCSRWTSTTPRGSS